MRFLPTASRRSSSLKRAPLPAATMAMTALMPMTMPRLVRIDRPMLTSRAPKATRMAERKLMLVRHLDGLGLALGQGCKRPPEIGGVAVDEAVLEQDLPAGMRSDVGLVGDHDNRLAHLTIELVE